MSRSRALLRTVFSRRTLYLASGSTALVGLGGYAYLNSGPAYPASTRESRRAPPPWTPPSRAEMLERLRRSGKGASVTSTTGIGTIAAPSKENEEEVFDILIVGGGATGAGVAVDAASRGLKVALVERDDFSSGTSSKSTKLVHGGVRYLQKAVFELDYDQYKLVKEALHERKIFLQTAPYLSHMLPIMLPIYKYWQVPYYWAGCKMYDLLAGKENMETSYVMSKGKALETFPMLKTEGLVGALVYYDGQHNDSRMNMALILTAVKHGAACLNYCSVTSLLSTPSSSAQFPEQLTGALVTDHQTNTTFPVRAKCIINATGPFSDTLLSMADPSHKPIVQPSSGIHVTLPDYYSPRKMGLLDPATSDGRVIFFLPWQGGTVAGTTDSPADVEREPKAGEEEIRWVLEEVRRYLSPDIRVRRGDVLSAWSGLRPLVRNPKADSTEGLVRNHMIYVSPTSGLLTVAGGKWTTYREMAEETVDEAIKVFGFENKIKTFGMPGAKKNGCATENVRLVGSDGWSRNMFIGLIQRYGLETDVAKHLSDNYGDRAWTVCSLAEPTGKNWPLHGNRLSTSHSFIDAEVRYAVSHEYALNATDVLARRTRLAFLDVQAALDALPTVVDIMAGELNWSYSERKRQINEAVRFLASMGLQGAVDRVKEGRVPEVLPRGRSEKAWAWAITGFGMWGGAKEVAAAEGRARFEPGELAALTGAFDRHARSVLVEGEKEEMIEAGRVAEAVREIPGYESVSEKDLDYVLDEARKQDGLDFDEFVEVCGNLKEVAFAPPVTKLKKRERKRIPVEKSGGGV